MHITQPQYTVKDETKKVEILLLGLLSD